MSDTDQHVPRVPGSGPGHMDRSQYQGASVHTMISVWPKAASRKSQSSSSAVRQGSTLAKQESNSNIGDQVDAL